MTHIIPMRASVTQIVVINLYLALSFCIVRAFCFTILTIFAQSLTVLTSTNMSFGTILCKRTIVIFRNGGLGVILDFPLDC